MGHDVSKHWRFVRWNCENKNFVRRLEWYFGNQTIVQFCLQMSGLIIIIPHFGSFYDKITSVCVCSLFNNRSHVCANYSDSICSETDKIVCPCKVTKTMREVSTIITCTAHWNVRFQPPPIATHLVFWSHVYNWWKQKGDNWTHHFLNM